MKKYVLYTYPIIALLSTFLRNIVSTKILTVYVL